MNKQSIISRIKQRLADLGISARAASLRAGLGPDAIRDMERRPDQSPTLNTVTALAWALECAPEWLAYGRGEDGSPSLDDVLPIRGEVAAGLWIEAEPITDDSAVERAPVPPSAAYPVAAQYGLRVRGTSINRRASEGDILRCIDIGMTGIEPQDDDIVIVQRDRDHGALREVTAKVLRRQSNKIVLHPDSNDPKHKAIIFETDDPAAREDESINARIIAVVDIIFRPTRK